MITLLATRETFSQEFAIYTEHQKRVYRLDTIPIEEAGEISQGVAVFHDITQERQTEKMRRDFVANVSHELRTPLSAITGYAETLLDGALEDQDVSKDFVQIIFNHSQRLTQLVRDLLDLSKLESEECPFELQPTNLQTIVEKVVELSQKALTEKKISLSYQKPVALPLVMAHESNIEQVVTNLLDNAIKYTPTGGSIQLRVFQQEQFVQVDVEDTGIGIEAKHIPRLFERFYRVDKARSRDLGGTGLGLSIVKHIVQYHGGDVFVKSRPGEGSTFSFTLCVSQLAE
jgi:two-component system phosphate regulon sensor histidine kinase PhoR